MEAVNARGHAQHGVADVEDVPKNDAMVVASNALRFEELGNVCSMLKNMQFSSSNTFTRLQPKGVVFLTSFTFFINVM